MKTLKVEKYCSPDIFGYKYRFALDNTEANTRDVVTDIDELTISGCRDGYETLINKHCNIKPFENLKGTILAVFITKKGVEYQVRYYADFEQKTEYFFDWEIEIC